jgi:CheY-like chemotaxis protein
VIVRRIMEAHGGIVALAHRGMVDVFPPDIRSNAMILLADDEPAFRPLTGAWLRGLGHEVEMVGDDDAACAAFAAKPADLVLLDLAMPPHHDPEAGLALIPAFAPAQVSARLGQSLDAPAS